MISIAFFNNKGGVGKTSLVYHCAWMLAELGKRVLAVDLDPQSNLSMMALDVDRLETLWPDDDHPQTLYGAVAPLFSGTGDIRPAHIESLDSGLGLLVGDLALSDVDGDLSEAWLRCEMGSARAFRVTTAFWRVIREAAARHRADLVLLDLGPNLGAINRAGLVASSHVVVPLAPDLFSVQGLRSLGSTLRAWRDGWQKVAVQDGSALGEIPEGAMTPIGYILMQNVERLGRPPRRASAKWLGRVVTTYSESVLGRSGPTALPDIHQIQLIKHYRSLMSMALEARKPMFQLTSADGAIGAHQASVQQCRADFETLCREIARRVGSPV